MLWDISGQRTSAEWWCTSNSAVFWVQPGLIFFYTSFPVVQYGSLEEPCQGRWLSRRVKPSHALALLQKGWFSSGCIITLMREVMSSLAPLSLAVSLYEANGLCWLRKEICVSTQGIFAHKVVLVVYLCVWNIYIFFFQRDLWKRGFAWLALPFLPCNISLAAFLLRSGVWSHSLPHWWEVSMINIF